jgi:hypothetical protein
MRQRTVATVLALIVTTATIPSKANAQGRQAEGSFDRTLNVSGGVNLEVQTGSGRIDIHSSSSNRVEVHAKIRAGSDWFGLSKDATDAVREIESNPPIEQNGNTIRIGIFDNRYSQRNVSISYEISVPPGSSVKSNSGSGSQTISGTQGPVDVHTGSGGITLSDARGQITATTGSGSITVTGIRGEFRGHTGSGGIRVQGEQTGRWEVQTGSGGIDIQLPKSASFDLNAHTGSGGVSVDFPMTVQGFLDGRRRDVTGKVGNGGYAMDLRTGSGHIRIE